MNTKPLLPFMLILLQYPAVHSEKPVGTQPGNSSGKTNGTLEITGAGCANPATSAYLEFNNVRALIHTGGDMFWDLIGNPKYEVPKGSGKHSMFSASLWLGGTDVNGQLRIAAQMYRSARVDFWTGPLSQNTASITPDECEKWDRFFIVSRKMVEEFLAWYYDPSAYPGYSIPQNILEWPAHGDPAKGQSYYLAPFFDNDNDGNYNPYNGDYPYYDMSTNTECNRSRDRLPKLYGDYTMWYVFNDKGNEHKETHADAIGLEVQAQAFAFATQDEINNMTFTNYIITNRSTFSLVNTYFGTFFDVDLGCAWDDFVGCDVARGLGYAYNGDAVDGNPCQSGSGFYDDKPPGIGIDFFEGPYQDPDKQDNPEILTIKQVLFEGSGNEYDLIAGGTYTGTGDATFIVRISDVTGLRDSFTWKKVTGLCDNTSQCPGGSWTPDSVIRGKEGGSPYPTAQLLSDGISISFLTNKNHPVNDIWLIQVTATGISMCNSSINGLNFGDGIVDNERWGMRRFIYFNNDNSPIGNPQTGTEYYRLLQGIWRDGQKMVYGGNGHPSGCPSSMPCIPTDFMFPGNPTTDPCGWGQAEGNGGIPVPLGSWDEISSGNGPFDRRFVHSAGPFVLKPGAVNDITTGVVWMQDPNGNYLNSIEMVRLADDKAQALFDNCFKLLNGPDAPCLSIRELDKELILYLENPKTSNNYLEEYEEVDPTIPDRDTIGNYYDRKYRFQGYLMYQLSDSLVSVDELDNSERARLIAQCDIKDGVKKIINYEFDPDLGISVPKLMAAGADNSIRHSFRVTEDAFSTTANKNLVNFKKYSFMAIAYAYNNYDNFDPSQGDIYGQMKPFLRGRKNCIGSSISSVTGVPHKPEPMESGTQQNSVYGDAPEITCYEGAGNGGLAVDISSGTKEEILNTGYATSMKYQKGKAPVNVKIVDPLNVKPGNFILKFIPDEESAIPVLSAKVFTWNAPPYGITGNHFFETAVDARTALQQGARFYVSGTGQFDGTYTVYDFDNTGTQVKTCERIFHDLGNITIPVTGKIYWRYNWLLVDETGNLAAVSEKPVDIGNEQLIPEYGISITIEQSWNPGPVTAHTFAPLFNSTPKVNLKISAAGNGFQNGLIQGSIEYSDNAKPWLDFIADGDGCDAFDWIRSGMRINTDPNGNCIFGECSDFFHLVSCNSFDPEEHYEKAASSTWAPYPLVSRDSLGPAVDYAYAAENLLSRIMSVDLVITPDETKWSRSSVLELDEGGGFSKGTVPKFSLRNDFSIDKNGKPATDTTGNSNPASPAFISGKSMSWFPGYAINVETGERLNIIFGENSRLKDELHGDDMLWNPSGALSSPAGELAIAGGYCSPGVDPGCPFWAGGMHYIYIVGNDIDGSGIGAAYDNGEWIYNTLAGKNPAANPTDYYKVLKNIMWVGMPMVKDEYVFDDPHNIPGEVRIRLRITRPYGKNGFGTLVTATKQLPGIISEGSDYFVRQGHAIHDGKLYPQGALFNAVNTIVEYDEHSDTLDKKLGFTIVSLLQNSGNPLYGFSLDEYAVRTSDREIAKSSIDLIGIVPNPYLGMSEYETGAVDNRVKIINLPQRAIISIFNINGTLVKKYDRDDKSNTWLDWDLKNNNNVPVSSGVYIVHILVPDVGEKALKWFGVIRPTDLEAF